MGSGYQILAARQVLERQLNAKHERYRVRGKEHARRQERVYFVRWAHKVETCQENAVTLGLFFDTEGRELRGKREMCKAIRNHLFDVSGVVDCWTEDRHFGYS